ncbi:MAG TPA: 8-amino-7-oxononanoate synthase [Gemmatimonadaceae bacterium]|nr:8-amino-7-oxononanoate synthase [Gemmatimonadaceae bacterium]
MSASTTASSLDSALAADLATLDRAGLRRVLRPLVRRHGAHVVIDGQDAIDFSSNDYLGLASDPRLAAAVTDALRENALGAGAARLISGDHPLHEALERELAEFKRAEAALLFGSGYLANVGTIPALAGRRDVIYADALNHASLIDACRLSRAEVRTFPHLDLAGLADMLDADRGRFRRRLIVVDGVFSMDGDLFPLCELTNIAQAYDAWTYVDDAHGTGVLGENGRGSAEHWRIEGQIDVIMGTLGKAFGVAGAYVTGSRVLIDYLLNRARAFVFTTAQPPALAAAALAALHVIQSEPELRARLRRNAARVRSALRVPGPAGGHIIPVLIGEGDATMRVGAALRERGILVGAVRPPTVPLGTSRLRITLSAAHTDDDIERLLGALAEVLGRS